MECAARSAVSEGMERARIPINCDGQLERYAVSGNICLRTAVDRRMESFHPSSEHLWGFGDVGDISATNLAYYRILSETKSRTRWESLPPLFFWPFRLSLGDECLPHAGPWQIRGDRSCRTPTEALCMRGMREISRNVSLGMVGGFTCWLRHGSGQEARLQE